MVSLSSSQPSWKQLDSFAMSPARSEWGATLMDCLGAGMALYAGFDSVWNHRVTFLGAVGFVWAIRKIGALILGYIVYPAAAMTTFLGYKSQVAQTGRDQIRRLQEEGFECKKIWLQKGGTRYRAIWIAHPETIHSGQWSLHGFGNAMMMETEIRECAKQNARFGSNTLLINGPSVMESGGYPTRDHMGSAFEMGLQFLEQKVQAKSIWMEGFSLGAGMLSEAIVQHDFSPGLEKGIRYCFVADRSFIRLSNAVGAMVFSWLPFLFRMLDVELDCEKAARKLAHLKIEQIIIQHKPTHVTTSDGIIPHAASLLKGLQDADLMSHKYVIESPSIRHNSWLPLDCLDKLSKKRQEFVASRSVSIF